MKPFDREHEQFPLAQCRFCRHTMNVQSRVALFNHELVCFQRDSLARQY